MESYKDDDLFISALEIDKDENNEINIEFVERLKKFFNSFVNAIKAKDSDFLKDLLDESYKISECDLSNTLPSFCFSFDVIKSFITSFQPESYQNLFIYTIHIFRNIYLSRFQVNFEVFIPSKLFDYLWMSISFSSPEENSLTLKMIKEIMGKSTVLYNYFNDLISNSGLYPIISKYIKENDYLDIFYDYIYYFTTKSRRIISEANIMLCYSIFVDIFGRHIADVEENGENTKIPKDEIIKLMKSFYYLVKKDQFFYQRDIFYRILQTYFLYHFNCINDDLITFTNIRILSGFSDIVYEHCPEGKSVKEKSHIIFDSYSVDFDGDDYIVYDILSKYINDLNKYIAIPFGSPNSDIPGHLCNVIVRLAKQQCDSDFTNHVYRKTKFRIPNPFNAFIKSEIIYNAKSVLEERDIDSKTNALKLFCFFLEGRGGFIEQILNLDIISIVASFLESDQKILKTALRFFRKLAMACRYNALFYPVESAIEQNNIMEILDKIAFSSEDKSISEKATILKKLIIENIFKTQVNPT